MVWFTFTFLLGIPNTLEEKLKDLPKEKLGKFEVEKSYIEIDVSKPHFMCHIEYVLIPNEAPKFIDVVCWNKAAKIYFENSVSAIIPLEIEKLKWIHFRVNHNVKFTNEDIPLFRSHSVKFTISLGSKKFGESAKFDKPKKFFGPKFSDDTESQSIKKQLFQPLSETVDDLPSVSYFKEHLLPRQQLYISLDTTLETSENYNDLFNALKALSKEYHDETFVKKPTFPNTEIPPIVDILKQNGNPETIPTKTATAKKLDKKPDVKNKEPEKIEFSITGEQFFSGIRFFENCIKYNSQELPFVFSIAKVKSLLNKVQSQMYSPLSIVISRLNELPHEQLEKDGITKLKFRYMICNNLLAESNLIPIDKRMKINYARTIFTNTMDKGELIYFIQTGGLNIDILGNVNKMSVQGQSNQLNESLRANETEEEFVNLGKVSADISSILLQPNRIRMECNFQMSNKSKESSDNESKDNFVSTNEFNSCKRRKQNGNFLNRYSVTTPVMTITAGLAHPLFNEFQAVTMNPNFFNRLFAVFYNVDSAVPVIQIIQDDVNEILGSNDYIRNGKHIRRPLTKNYTGGTKDVCPSRNSQMTGFIIDCEDKVLIFTESSVFGGIQKIWAATSYMNPIHGHILYDSSLIFLGRLYENFLRYGGFIGITLKEPPQVTLSKAQSYGSQSVPKPAWRALTCLSLLTDCKSIRTATKNNLFPDFKSLASLAVEFGAPIRFSEKR